MVKVKYASEPYVLLSKEGIVLSAGSKEEIEALHKDSYYSNCKVEPRQYDLYLHDNTTL